MESKSILLVVDWFYIEGEDWEPKEGCISYQSDKVGINVTLMLISVSSVGHGHHIV